MTAEISEAAFEEAIQCALLYGGNDACPDTRLQVAERRPSYGEGSPGGYHSRTSDQYDRERCLIPEDLLDFVVATQPEAWRRLKEHHGEDVRDAFLARVAREVDRRGTLHVLRNGVKEAGVRFELAYFRPVSGLNEEHLRLYEGNIFSVVRQLHYSDRDKGNSLDLALFLNGLPLFTAELKTHLTGQNVKRAVAQYMRDRDPNEPLFRFGRCLAHFAVDTDLVQVTTRLEGRRTRFLPFNRGKFGGAGNPPVQEGYATAYLWERIWARDSVLNLIQHFIHEMEPEGDGKKNRKKILVFPRYHQLDSVRELVEHSREHGTGERYLIQHSAGSGKSLSIAWLAHQLSMLHDEDDEAVFDSVVVITDRRVLDQQLQNTVRQIEKTRGVVQAIEEGSKQLKEALETGKKIVVSTLQKFPYISQEIGKIPGRRFAVIIDEAHSSQSGEMTKSLKETLAVDDLDEAEEEDVLEEDIEDQLVAEMKARGPQPNVSTFAFTATPKQKTLELFGARQDDGRFQPFSLYSMRQAIEEGFILDVLENYTTYETAWRLLKTADEDPRYDKVKATRLLRNFVELHPHAIEEKVRIIVAHFHERVSHEIKSRAKAMIVTRSRKHAVRYHRILERHLKEAGYGYQALVAFSGTVHDEGMEYTERSMNGFPDTQTKSKFEKPEYRFLVVANKFQTGFDQPLLHTMYVDKKLGGVNAVQTLSRLNRTHPDKPGCMVLDFANEASAIQASFADYYETTLLSEGTDPQLLDDLQVKLENFHLFDESELNRFAEAYLSGKAKQDALYGILRPVRERFEDLEEEEQDDFRGGLTEFVRLYAFLSQLLTFADPELERLYIFSRYLRRYLPVDRDELPREIQGQIDLESLEVKETGSGSIASGRKADDGVLDPRTAKGHQATAEELRASLSEIIKELNDRFGAELCDKDIKSLKHLERQLREDPGLEASVRANAKENVRLTFNHKVEDHFKDMAESNFELFKRIVDDERFGEVLLDRLFDRFWRVMREGD